MLWLHNKIPVQEPVLPIVYLAFNTFFRFIISVANARGKNALTEVGRFEWRPSCTRLLRKSDFSVFTITVVGFVYLMLSDRQVFVHSAVTVSSCVLYTEARHIAPGWRLHTDAGLLKVRCSDGECQCACYFVHLAKNLTPVTKPSKSDLSDSKVASCYFRKVKRLYF